MKFINKDTTHSMKIRVFIVFTCYLAIACLILSNAIFSNSKRVVGEKGLAVWDHLWHFWWINHSLSNGVSPFHTNLLFFPSGLDVFKEMPAFIPSLMSVPFQYVFGLIFTYNLFCMLSLTIGAFGCFLLCKKITGKTAGSFAGGLVFGFSPFFMTELTNGALELVLASSLLPYYLMLLLKMNKNPVIKNAFYASALLITSSLTSWYSLALSPFLAGYTFIFGLFNKKNQDKKKLLISYMVFVLISLLALLIPLHMIMNGPKYGSINWKECVNLFKDKACVNIFHFFSYSNSDVNLNEDYPQKQNFAYNVYMGKIVVFLILLLFSSGFRDSIRWKIGLLLFILLCMGPYLNIGGSIKWKEMQIPLPARCLVWLPGFNALFSIHSYRFSAIIMLFSGVLCAKMITKIIDNLELSMKGVIAIVLGFSYLIIVDFGQSVPLKNKFFLEAADTRIPQCYEYLKQVQPAGAVLDIPLLIKEHYHSIFSGPQMYYQTEHGHPIYSGIADHPPLWGESFSLIKAASSMASHEQIKLEPELQEKELCKMYEIGFRFIVVNWSLILDRDKDALHDLLNFQLGKPIIEKEHVAVYEMTGKTCGK